MRLRRSKHLKALEAAIEAIEAQPLKQKSEHSPPTSYQFEREELSNFEEFFRERYVASNNPLFIWHMILARQYLMEMIDTVSVKEALQRDPLPDWAMQYLVQVAWRLHELMIGCDWRSHSSETRSEERKGSAISACGKPRYLLPPQAADLVALTLGVTREAGWNAFSEWKRIYDADQAENALALLRNKGIHGRPLKPREAKEMVMEAYGFGDERAFRRFLAKVKGRAKPG